MWKRWETNGRQGLFCLLWASSRHSINGSIILCALIITIKTYPSLINRKVGSIEVKLQDNFLSHKNLGKTGAPETLKASEIKTFTSFWYSRDMTRNNHSPVYSILNTSSKREKPIDISQFKCYIAYTEYFILHCLRTKKRGKEKIRRLWKIILELRSLSNSPLCWYFYSWTFILW